MATIEIDTNGIYGDVEQQVMEMSTSELLQVYDFFERNPTVFTTVANELDHRREHEEELDYEGQEEEINRRFR